MRHDGSGATGGVASHASEATTVQKPILMAQAGVKSGTLYPLLMRLEAQGLLEARWVDSPQSGRPPRHVYRLTGAGRDWVVSLSEPLAALRAPSVPLRAAKARL